MSAQQSAPRSPPPSAAHPTQLTGVVKMSQTTRNVQPVTANLGKEGSGDLVPSRYAVRVGDVDVVLISDGILPLPTSTMSTTVTESDRNEWFDRSEERSGGEKGVRTGKTRWPKDH